MFVHKVLFAFLEFMHPRLLLVSPAIRLHPWGGGVNPYNGPYGEALPERGTFFRLQVYKRVGISQVEAGLSL